jgi:fructose-1,6-bisphosphatase I
MESGLDLTLYLRSDGVAAGRDAELAPVVEALAQCARVLSDRIARPAIEDRLGASVGGVNADGDAQRRLDVLAEALFCEALGAAGVACLLSEEQERPSILDPKGSLALAIDPLDGSSNIDVNAPIGTIFSIRSLVEGALEDPFAPFRQPGRLQLGAGFFVYGPQTSLVLSLGRGVQRFTLDRDAGRFLLVDPAVTIPLNVAEYAINASNYRHWHEPIQSYIDDCVMGTDGPRGCNFNMRWIASLVADAFRIFTRGGIFLYPADRREGYERGRLRLLYEASPMAFLTEQAGGGASDGVDPILDQIAQTPHQRTPFVMGSADKVERVKRYHASPASPARDSPLFGRRGLLRV